MKENSLLISIICFLTQMGFSQKEYTISGQVFSTLSGFPLTYHQDVPNTRLRIDGDSIKTTFFTEKGAFKLNQLQSGTYKLVVEFSNPSGELWFAKYDTTLTINKQSLKNVIISVPCTYCDCWGVTRDEAVEDIKKGKPLIFLFQFGISGLMKPQPNDEGFQKKYGIKYAGYGCTSPDSECIGAYNAVIFEYLDKKFGKKWRTEARTDVICLKR